MYFTLICAEFRFGWVYVASRVAYFDRFRGMDTSGLPVFMEFRCILFLDTSESGVLVESRCIWNVWFLEHTSEMPPFRAFPMYYCISFSRRYIGIEISMPIPMYAGPNLSKIYIGMGQYRLLPMYRQKSPKQNTSEFDNFFQSRCIKIQHTSETQVFFKSRCISINFPR